MIPLAFFYKATSQMPFSSLLPLVPMTRFHTITWKTQQPVILNFVFMDRSRLLKIDAILMNTFPTLLILILTSCEWPTDH
jgi:hypothetical protein